jgi:hypothetical protein
MLACLDDLASDLSAWHRVDDMTVLPARSFLGLVHRLHHYQGAWRAAVVAAQEEVQEEAPVRHREMYPVPDAPPVTATHEALPAIARSAALGPAQGMPPVISFAASPT